jgi:phosphate transport system substrate-binding protein
VENFGQVVEAVPTTTTAENYSFDQLFEPTIDEVDITLVSTTPGDGLVSWQVSEAQKAAVRSQGGERLALRIYDMTNADSNDRPDSVWEYECSEADEQKQVRLYAGDRFYVAELGYISPEGRWLALARSHSLWVDNITTEEAD